MTRQQRILKQVEADVIAQFPAFVDKKKRIEIWGKLPQFDRYALIQAMLNREAELFYTVEPITIVKD